MADDSWEAAADRLGVLRVIDANLNRATEGLRVVEEYCRFVLDDAHLTHCYKGLRHELVAAISGWPRGELAAARDTPGDVGTTAQGVDAMGARGTAREVATASSERAKQALRAIEEYGKTLDGGAARRVEALRYRLYTLEKAWLNTADSRERLSGAQLYVLIDAGPSEAAFVERARRLIAVGVHVLQLRDKACDDRTLVSRARLLRRLVEEGSGFRVQGSGFGVQGSDNVGNAHRGVPQASGEQESGAWGQSHPSSLIPHPSSFIPLLIINDRPDVAVLARADGVHVGQEELSVADVRRIVGPQMLVGVSTHTIEQARQAVLDGANYLGCGPTFPSGTKHFEHFPGLALLRQVAAEISLPAFAIGGITLERLPDVLATGLRRVAVSGALASEAALEQRVGDFLTLLARPHYADD